MSVMPEPIERRDFVSAARMAGYRLTAEPPPTGFSRQALSLVVNRSGGLGCLHSCFVWGLVDDGRLRAEGDAG